MIIATVAVLILTIGSLIFCVLFAVREEIKWRKRRRDGRK